MKQSKQENSRTGGFTAVCFFLIAVSYKLAWTAISSLLTQFSRDYGPAVLLQLNIAYFLPSIPILILQSAFNDKMDKALGGIATGSAARFFIGLGGLAITTACFPILATTHVRLLATTATVGILYGVAFGTSYQLASRFAPINTVMLTTGFVSSGPIVLMIDLMLKTGTYYNAEGLKSLFRAVSWITAGGLAASGLLITSNKRTLNPPQPQHVDISKLGLARYSSGKAGRSRAHSLGTSAYASNSAIRNRSDGSDAPTHSHGQPDTSHSIMIDMLEAGHDSSTSTSHTYGNVGKTKRDNGPGRYPSAPWQAVHSENGVHRHGSTPGHSGGGSTMVLPYDSKEQKPEVPLIKIAWRISPAAFSIFLSVGTSMLVFPFFTYMTSTGLLGERLAQVLFYVRLVGDILGRLVPRQLQATTISQLMFWAAVKTAMVPLLFGSIFRPHATGGDLGAVVLVAGFWVLSGYVNTCSYLVAPTLVPLAAKARASGLMTVAFQSSCFIALIMAAAIQKSGTPASYTAH